MKPGHLGPIDIPLAMVMTVTIRGFQFVVTSSLIITPVIRTYICIKIMNDLSDW